MNPYTPVTIIALSAGILLTMFSSIIIQFWLSGIIVGVGSTLAIIKIFGNKATIRNLSNWIEGGD